MQKSSLKKILSAVTIFAVAAATAFSVPVSARAEEEAVVQGDVECPGTEEIADNIPTYIDADYEEYDVDINGDAVNSIDEISDIDIVGANRDLYYLEYDVKYRQTDARSMLTYMNEFRTGSDAWAYDQSGNKVYYSNLQPLEYDYELEKIAMQRAAEIVIMWGHTRPDGSSCGTAVTEAGYSWNSRGENLAAGYSGVKDTFVQWQETDKAYSGQGHRRNMLSSAFTRVGMACVVYNSTPYWVQVFARSTQSNSYTTPNDSLTTVHANLNGEYLSKVDFQLSSTAVEVDANKSVAIPTCTTSIFLTTTWNYRSTMCTVRPEYTYEFSDTSVAEIRNGQIYGLKAGTTTLTISALGESTDVAVTVKSTDISLEMTGVSIDILDGGSADLYIHFQTSTAKEADTSLKVVMKDSTGKELDTKTYNCADYTALNTTADGVVNYKISYPMAVTDMNKKLEVSVCYKGTAVSTKTFSVEEYLYLVMEQPPNEKTKNICIALLNYGAAVQEYFNIDTDKLVNRNLTASQKPVTTITKSMVEGYTDDGLVLNMATGYIQGLSYLGTSLVLDGVGGIKLRVYMMVDADKKASLNYYPQNGSTISWKQNLFYADMPIKIGECNEKDLVLRVAEKSDSAKVNEVYSCPYVYMNAALNQSNPNPELIALLSALYQLDKVCRG